MRLGAKIGNSFEIDWEKRQRNLKNDYFCEDFDKTNQSNRATDMMQYQVFGDVLFYMLYGGVAVAAIIACCYLLFRRGNAFTPDVTSTMCLRRWASAFLATIVMSHVRWLLFYQFHLVEDQLVGEIISIGLDCMIFVPAMMATLLAMLQDRRRPLWMVGIVIVPIVVTLMVWFVRRHDNLEQLMPFFLATRNILLHLYTAFFVYMIISAKQYRKWLRDNYADLENKEVWQSIVVLVGFMFVLFIYWFDDGNKTIGYLIQGTKIILIALLLWRVETLQQLDAVATEEADTTETPAEPEIATMALPSGIGQLLERHCEDAQLYLQHELTLSQLSHTIGTNHYYLSQHFTQQGLTYNAYINGLRIRHFIKLYHEAVATQRPFTAQQLANESGFRSYSTFSAAFKQRMGQTVTAWMRDTEKAQNNLLLRVTFSKSAKKAFQNLQFLWILQKSSWNVQNIRFEFFEAIRMQENGLFLRNCRNNNCRNNI